MTLPEIEVMPDILRGVIPGLHGMSRIAASGAPDEKLVLVCGVQQVAPVMKAGHVSSATEETGHCRTKDKIPLS